MTKAERERLERQRRGCLAGPRGQPSSGSGTGADLVAELWGRPAPGATRWTNGWRASTCWRWYQAGGAQPTRWSTTGGSACGWSRSWAPIPATPHFDRHRQLLTRPSCTRHLPPPAATGPPNVPRELRAAPTSFVGLPRRGAPGGRGPERGELERHADALGHHRRGRDRQDVAGPGVGVPPLDRFPDGQLYADLRGFSPGQPADGAPGRAAPALVRPGRRPGAVPPHTTPGRALPRACFADQRVLMVLDNAAGH